MAVGVAGDLRQVRDAQHLMVRRELAELVADDRAEPAADVGVDLVEHQHADRGRSAARMPFSASMIRDSSPPEAILRRGCGGQAGVGLRDELDCVETRRRARLARRRWSTHAIVNFAFSMPSSASCFSISGASFFAAACALGRQLVAELRSARRQRRELLAEATRDRRSRCSSSAIFCADLLAIARAWPRPGRRICSACG